MDKEHFLNQKVTLDTVYLHHQPNKFGDKIDLFYFCIYNKEKDLFCFLNDLQVFSGDSVRELVPENPADRINCMYYFYEPADNPSAYVLGMEPNEDDEYFCWEIGPTNDLATIVECDEVYNLKDELKELLENYLAPTATYKIKDLCRIEEKFIAAQMAAEKQISLENAP